MTGYQNRNDRQTLDEPGSLVPQSRTGDNLIIGVVIFMVAISLFWLLNSYVRLLNFSSWEYRVFSACTTICWGAVPLLLGFAVREKRKRLVVLILAII